MLTAAVLLVLIVLVMHAPLDLVITASQVRAGANARLGRALAAEALVRGDAIYLDSTNANKATKSDANAGTDAAAKVDGIVLNDVGVDQYVDFQQPGDELTLGAAAAVVVGTPYVLSANAGKIAPVTDLVAGWRVTLIGVGKAGGKIARLLLSASDQVRP